MASTTDCNLGIGLFHLACYCCLMASQGSFASTIQPGQSNVIPFIGLPWQEIPSPQPQGLITARPLQQTIPSQLHLSNPLLELSEVEEQSSPTEPQQSTVQSPTPPSQMLTQPVPTQTDIAKLAEKYSGGDSRLFRMMQMQLESCPFTVSCNPAIFPLPYYPYASMTEMACCDPCDCSSECKLNNGECCPERLKSLPQLALSTELYKICKYAQMKLPSYIKNERNSFYMISDCPKTYTDEAVTENCIRPQTKNSDDLHIFVPVSSKSSGKIFRNIYCSRCNLVPNNDAIMWEVNIKCVDEASVTLDVSIQKLMRQVWKEEKCNILFYPPEGINNDELFCDGDLISECNRTGLWEEYDPFVVDACHAYTSRYDRFYKNVFCFICNSRSNSRSLPGSLCTVPMPELNSRAMVSFAAVLDFQQYAGDIEESTAGPGSCTQGSFYDEYKRLCQKIYCSPLRVYRNGTCVSIVEAEMGSSYEIYFKLIPDQRIWEHEINDVGRMIETKVLEFVYWESYDLVEPCTIKIFHKTEDHPATKKYIMENSSNFFAVYLAFTVGAYHPSHFSPDAMLTKIQSINFEFNITWPFVRTIALDHEEHSVDLSVFELSSASLASFYESYFADESNCKEPTRITTLLTCPQVELRDFIFNRSRDGNMDVPEMKLRLTSTEYDVTEETNGSVSAVRLCMDKYKHWIENIKRNDDILISTNPETILSFICICVSLLCLLITFVTYLLFKSLRSLPGKNNMALAFTLFVAQMTFQFGADKVFLELGCKVIGMAIHFFLLAAVMWMNVCSFHMFRVFTTLEKHPMDLEGTCTFLIYCSYAFVISALFVVTNVVVSLIFSGNTSIGYGIHLCYISQDMILYTFAIPVGIAIILNIVLFLIVVVKIQKMPSVMQNVKRPRNNLLIYAKLSTLTGLTWVFGFVYEWTSIKAFAYVFIVLNAGQGLLIMLAFICNHRVKALYAGLCCKRSRKQPCSRQSSHNTATRSSLVTQLSTDSSSSQKSCLEETTVIHAASDPKSRDASIVGCDQINVSLDCKL